MVFCRKLFYWTFLLFLFLSAFLLPKQASADWVADLLPPAIVVNITCDNEAPNFYQYLIGGIYGEPYQIGGPYVSNPAKWPPNCTSRTAEIQVQYTDNNALSNKTYSIRDAGGNVVSVEGSECTTISSQFYSCLKTVSNSSASYTITVAASDTAGNTVSSTNFTFSFTTYSISGHVYESENCSGTTAAPTTTVNLTGGLTSNTNSNGTTGDWSFSGLHNANYSVAITLPANYTLSTCNTQPRTFTNLSASQTEVNFYITHTRFSISGFVFEVSNYNNCSTIVSNITNHAVNLTGGSTQTHYTNSGGYYEFASLLSGGNYTVGTSPPAGYDFASCSTTTRIFNNLQANENVNFFFVRKPSISGHVYLDPNRTCSTASGFNGRTVNLTGNPSGSTTTDGNGVYSFTNLTFTENYIVAPQLPTDYVFTPSCSASSATINNLTSDITNVNFYMAPPLYTISGTVFADYNNNAQTVTSPETGENGLSGATVSITGLTLTYSNSTTTNLLDLTNFSFGNLLSGTYRITLTIPTQYGSTSGSCPTPRSCTTTTYKDITVGPNQTVNFGLIPLCNNALTGKVFYDNNHNGVQNAGEGGYSSGASTPISVTGLGAVATDTNGTYDYTDVLPGTYNVVFTIPSNYGSTLGSCSTPRTCKNPLTTTIPVTVANDCSVTPVNPWFGITPLYTVTTSVYEERSCPANLVRDAGDPGYQGATVTLGSFSGTTNASGQYVFTDVLSGSYNAGLNSVSGYTILTPNPVLVTASGPAGSNFPVNFMIGQNWTVSGTLYNDVDDSGTINAGDTPFIDGSQTVTLTPGSLSGNSSIVNGTYTINNVYNRNYTASLPIPSGYKAVIPPSQAVNLCNANVSAVNFLIQGFTISGNVNIDHNHNGSHDSYDEYLNNATLALSGGYTARPNTTTNASGYYIFHDLKGGVTGYNVTFTLPAGYQMVSANPVNNITLGPDRTVNFYITPLYTISGNVYKDNNKNRIKDGGETNYDPITITSTGDAITYPSAGLYKVTGLISGSYTISYISLPLDFEMTYPINGPPPSFTVAVGKNTPSVPPAPYTCNTNSYNSAVCFQDAGTPYSGSIQNLNFGITNSVPWWQCVGGDCRSDSGIDNPVPPNPPNPPIPNEGQCTRMAAITDVMSSQHGVFFSGNDSYSFCLGGICPDRASTNSWIVGGTTNPEIYSPVNNSVIRTSYNYLRTTARQNGLTEKDLATVCPGLNCTLPADLASGVYLANGNLTLTGSGTPPTYTFPASRNIVILINGELIINTNLIVPIGSSVTFSASTDIHVSRSIGVLYYQNCNPTTHQYCNIEGFYSAGGSFILDGNGEPACSGGIPSDIDSRLNIAGSIVTNGNLIGGAIVNQRDLCENNLACPSYSITERPDLILNAPEFLKVPTYVWNEAAP